MARDGSWTGGIFKAQGQGGRFKLQVSKADESTTHEASRMQAVEQRPARVMAAMAGGLLAATLGAGLWFLVAWMFDVHASFLAALVGPFAGMGAWLLHRRQGSVILQGWSVLITLVVLLAAEAMVVRMIAVRGLSEQLVDQGTNVPVMLPFDVMWNLVATGLTQDPITPLFFAISLWYAISIPKARQEEF